jgi:hypothetical protein
VLLVGVVETLGREDRGEKREERVNPNRRPNGLSPNNNPSGLFGPIDTTFSICLKKHIFNLSKITPFQLIQSISEYNFPPKL